MSGSIWSRRRFLQGAVGIAASAATPLAAQSLDLVVRGVAAPFRVACLSDLHLFARGRSHRYARSASRAIEQINGLEPQPDLVLFAGDLAQGGRRDELELGCELLRELRAPVHVVPGEHDWYLDMGAAWRELFGPDRWAFDHRGVRFVGLNSIGQADFWTAAGMSAEKRMAVAGGLDDVRQNGFEVGGEQLAWLEATLADLPPKAPIVVLSHAPLHRRYREWNFWSEDAAQVQRILGRFDAVTVLHGHVRQASQARQGNVSFHGLLATSLPLPEPPDEPTDATTTLRFPPEASIGYGLVTFHPGSAAEARPVGWSRRRTNPEQDSEVRS